jgi:DNA-binding PadR family transcriptional regulator
MFGKRFFGHHGGHGFGHHWHAMRGHGRGGGRSRRHGGAPEDSTGEGGFFGRRGFGGGSGGGRVFGPGDLRLVLLSLIAEKPRHGYELIKELEQKFSGGYTPSPGSVYPTLTLLEELGFLRSTAEEGTKRLFEVTAAGKRHLDENEAALNSALARMDMAAKAASGERPPNDLHHAMHTLKAALMFHRGGWDEKETERVRKIIEAAAHEIGKKP